MGPITQACLKLRSVKPYQRLADCGSIRITFIAKTKSKVLKTGLRSSILVGSYWLGNLAWFASRELKKIAKCGGRGYTALDLNKSNLNIELNFQGEINELAEDNL